MALHFLVGVVVVVAVSLLAPRAAGYPWILCGFSNSFEANSTYQSNLKLLAATLPKNASASPTLYCTAVVGVVPEQFWGMGLCRGDTNASSCLSCLTQAFQDLTNNCSYYKDATIYYDPCILHYSDVHTLDDTGPAMDTYVVSNNNNVTSDPARFMSLLAALMNATAEYAANNSTRRFATGEADFDKEFPKLYTLAQCVPEQTPAQCGKCLAGIVAGNLGVFQSNIGGRVLRVNCFYRYETAPFFNGPAMVRLASPSSAGALATQPTVGTPAAAGAGNGRGRVLAIILPIVIMMLAIVIVCYCILRRKKKPAGTLLLFDSTNPEDIQSFDSLIIDLPTLRAATGNFDEGRKLGQGGFGAVYKGILSDGREIAVKRLSQSSRQGIKELKTELVLVAKLQHKNLVRLVGVCLEEHEKLLVYEYMPNNSLDTFLFDPDKSNELDWQKRFMIIKGIANGLRYLHEESLLKIVHRDLKASNVLLDSDFNPKISDFGLARLFGSDQSQYVTSRVAGTYGYMAPEYAMRGQFSFKSDVFSYGVLMLEIVAGRRNSDCSNDSEQYDHLLSSVWERWTLGTTLEIMDPSLSSHTNVDQMLKCIHIGLLCVQHNPADRPTMSTVNLMLSSSTVPRQAPSRPAFCFLRSGVNSEMDRRRGNSHSTSRAAVSENEVTVTELEAR